MSLLGGFFKKKEVVPTTQEAIQKLMDTEELLSKKQAFLEAKIKEAVETAVKHGTANKRVALQALNKKRQLQKNLEQIDNVLGNIEFQRASLENASTNAEVLNVMGAASKALKAAHNNMDIDNVHDLMEDIAEQQEVAAEIAGVISNPLMGGAQADEDELLAELEALQQEEMDKHFLEVKPTPVSLPDVPSRELPTAAKATKSKEQDDLDALSSWATG